jgi:site-specific DNA recombinase
MFQEAWGQRVAQAKAVQAQLKTMLTDLTKQVDQMLERVVAADTPVVIRAYETKIAELESQKLVLTEKLEKQSKPQRTFEELFELALWFLSNPWKLWSSGQFHLQRIVLRLAFLEGAAYTRKSGFSNVKTAMPFRLLENADAIKDELARPKGFEPLTPRFVVWCSIQLSYGRVCQFPCRNRPVGPDGRRGRRLGLARPPLLI